MLVLLLPEQISDWWEAIEYTVIQALPIDRKKTKESVNAIYAYLLDGSLQCWVSYEEDEEKVRPHGIITTKLVYDDTTGTRNLDIFTLYGDKVSYKEWKEGLETLRKYAIANGCHRVIGRSDLPGLIAACGRMGANVDYTLITFELENEDEGI